MNEETGRYFFLTDQDLLYACWFDNLTPFIPHMVVIYDIEINDFSFVPQGGQSKAHDPRISPTITELLKGYFTDDTKVLVYLCAAADGRARERQVLYTRWHRNMADMVDHETVEIPLGEEVVYGGIFTRKDFPYQDTMNEQLRAVATKLIAEKLGQ